MAFEKLVTRRGRGNRAVGCRIFVDAKHGGNGKLFIATDVAAALGWASGDPIGIEVGTGSDAGRIRLARRADGGRRAFSLSTHDLIVSLPVKALGLAPRKTTMVPHEVVGDVLFVTLPAAKAEAAE